MTATIARSVEEVDWEAWEPGIHANLLFVIREGRILLIRKKRGLGAGNINGPGGKLDEGETAQEAALREVEEEVGIQVLDPEEMGTLCFQFIDGLRMHCTVFRAGDYQGVPVETDEAIPLWFPVDAIPFDEMWEDDRHWLPQMIEGKRFEGYFIFRDKAMLSKRICWKE